MAVGIVIVYSVGFWLLSARKWFTGPVKQIAGKSCLSGSYVNERVVNHMFIRLVAEEMGIDITNPAVVEKADFKT